MASPGNQHCANCMTMGCFIMVVNRAAPNHFDSKASTETQIGFE